MSEPEQRPDPTPEGLLIQRAMVRKGVNATDVAAGAGITPGRWRHIVNGAQPLGGGRYHPVRAPAATLARMALAVDVTPEELEAAGRPDAAEVLRDLGGQAPPPEQDWLDPDTGEEYTDDDERDVWGLTRLPAAERRKLIYYMRAERARQQAEGAGDRGRRAG